jgi:hypothetical protein
MQLMRHRETQLAMDERINQYRISEQYQIIAMDQFRFVNIAQ